jgi:hypothetical protein
MVGSSGMKANGRHAERGSLQQFLRVVPHIGRAARLYAELMQCPRAFRPPGVVTCP